MRYAGVDYGNKISGTTVLVYVLNNQILFSQCEKKKDADVFLMTELVRLNCTHIFIDAPLSLPGALNNPATTDDYFFRPCDRELKAMSPMFIGGLTARAIQLRHRLEKWGAALYEVHPSSFARHNNFAAIGYKETVKNIPAVMNALVPFLAPFELKDNLTNWHQVDALMCFIIGKKYFNNSVSSAGSIEQGIIYF